MKWVLPLIVLLLAGCAADDPYENAIAMVNDEPITMEAYQREYIDYLGSAGLSDDPMRRQAFLNRMIAVRMIIAEARETGIEQGEAYAREAERARQKLLIDGYLADEVYDTIRVGEDDLEAFFVRANTKLTARHLYATSREGAQALRERLEAGESFDALAREVFADPVLAANGGLVGTFGFDEMDPSFEEAAYALGEGELSDPVRTAQGWSVIKLEGRFTDPVLTEDEFARRLPQMQDYVQKRRRELARRAVLGDITDALNLSLDEETATAVLDRLQGRTVAEADAEAALAAQRLVTFNRDGTPVTWTVSEFLDAAAHTTEAQRVQVQDREGLQAFIEGLASRAVLLDRGLDLSLPDDPRYREALAAAMEDWVYEQAFESLVSGFSLPEDTLRAYFEANSGDFRVPARIRVSELVTTDLRTADSLRAALAVRSFESLVREHSLRPESAAAGGDLGWLTEEALGPWSDDVWPSDVGSVVGPFPAAGKYLLLKVTDREDTRPASFDEARADVEQQLLLTRRQDYLRTHVQSLRGRFPVSILVDSLPPMPVAGPSPLSS